MTMSFLIGIVALLLIGLLLKSEAKNRRKPGTLYTDSSDSRVFSSSAYNIRAKPDAITDRKTIEEFKSRANGIYPSDRAQMIATTIAVRSVYPVENGVLVTKGRKYHVDLSESDSELYNKIGHLVDQVRLVKSNKVPVASPAVTKCKSCDHRNRCVHSAV